MDGITPQAGFPWSGPLLEDIRFRRILRRTLLSALVIGAAAPYIPLPEPVTETADRLPPPRVRLLQAIPPPVTESPQPQPAANRRPPPPASIPPARKATESGVLAMRDVLRELRDIRPNLTPALRRRPDAAATPPSRPMRLTANVTRIGRTGDIGASHRAVLGDTDLPPRGDDADPGGGAADHPHKGAADPDAPTGVLRSVEEIQEILDRNKGAMFSLYNRALLADSGLQGTLVMSITIEPSGAVSRCAIVSSTMGSSALERDMVALVRGIRFGDKPRAPPVTTRVPIEFFPI